MRRTNSSSLYTVHTQFICYICQDEQWKTQNVVEKQYSNNTFQILIHYIVLSEQKVNGWNDITVNKQGLSGWKQRVKRAADKRSQNVLASITLCEISIICNPFYRLFTETILRNAFTTISAIGGTISNVVTAAVKHRKTTERASKKLYSILYSR